MNKGLGNKGQCRGGRVVIVDDGDVLRINDVEEVDGVDCRGAEEAYAVEEVADNVFLCEPAIFPVVVQSRIRDGFLKELLSCALPGFNWNHKVLCAFKNEINGLLQTEYIFCKHQRVST